MRKTVSIILAAASMVFITGASSLNRQLAKERQSVNVRPVTVLKDAPPIMVFTTVVLGGFRGIIADLLWVRLSQLQDEGKFFELVQLSDWITKLEPHLGKVWTHHAWNMAYNVSIMMPDPDERWKWVKNGISLLRDEGLAYNPGDKWLYFNLGWFFQHKIGDPTDETHLYYRKRWNMEMRELFGGPRPDFSALKNNPGLVSRMEKEYKLFPEIMMEIEKAYGPFDWTQPETHAVYWAYTGIKKTGLKDDLWLSRMIRQNLRELGKITEDPPEQGPVTQK